MAVITGYGLVETAVAAKGSAGGGLRRSDVAGQRQRCHAAAGYDSKASLQILLLYVVREIFVVAATALVTPTTELFMRVCSVIVLKYQNIKANEAVDSNKSKV